MIIQKKGEIGDDVVYSIKVGWIKWRSTTKILCNRKVPTKLKGKFNSIVIRLAIFYNMECWTIRKIYAYKMNVAEMIMLRWRYDNTRKDKKKMKSFVKR